MAIDHLAASALIGTLALVSTGELAYSLIVSDYTNNNIRLPVLSCHLHIQHLEAGHFQLSFHQRPR